MPPTGPDSIIITGRFVAAPGAITPPFDCMMARSPAKPAALRRVSRFADIAADLRADVGVHHGRRGTLVLAVFAQDLVRQRDEGVGQRGLDDLARDALVLGIGIGMEKAHRHRIDALARQLGAGGAHAFAAQALAHLARGIKPLVDLERQVPRHQRARAVEEEVVGLGPVAAADHVDVARAARDEEADLGALALDQRVDGDGRTVDQGFEMARVEPGLADRFDDAVHRIARRGQRLGMMDPSGTGIERDEIGEGAADIDSDEGQGSSCWRRR